MLSAGESEEAGADEERDDDEEDCSPTSTFDVRKSMFDIQQQASALPPSR
jgi:hypothetical protein